MLLIHFKSLASRQNSRPLPPVPGHTAASRPLPPTPPDRASTPTHYKRLSDGLQNQTSLTPSSQVKRNLVRQTKSSSESFSVVIMEMPTYASDTQTQRSVYLPFCSSVALVTCPLILGLALYPSPCRCHTRGARLLPAVLSAGLSQPRL